MTKKFLIQLQYDEQTRFPDSTAELLATLKPCVKAAVRRHTSGSIPLVTITEEEKGEEVPIVHAKQ